MYNYEVPISWFHLFLIVLAVFMLLTGLVTLGLSLRPRPFRAHPVPTRLEEHAPYLPGLPAPVRRHFEAAIGETPPLIHTAVVWGRGKALVRGVWTPLRFKGWYRPAESFVRRMEFTFFLRPVMRGIERFTGSEGGFELGEEAERGPELYHDQVLALWSEAVWMPSVFVHDPRIRWEAQDEHSARLIIPTRAGEETLQAFFDPLSGCLTHFTGLRTPAGETETEPWRFDLFEWKRFHDLLIPTEITVAWGEAGSPWLYMTVDGVAYNVNVSDQL
ncbi:MAG: hypothetical protein IH586_18245 [Anaerolineaceae bacterium]|nr:hypothetical protein [Anaerolineaceae bacterium]